MLRLVLDVASNLFQEKLQTRLICEEFNELKVKVFTFEKTFILIKLTSRNS